MARYKHTDAEDGQGMFLTVNLKEQLLPGTFEFMLNDLIGGRIDVSTFDKSYTNDKTGATAIAPAALIKLIIYGYSKGVKSSRRLGELAGHNIIAKALSGNTEPHWTTIAGFISGNCEKFQEVFVKVLAYCNGLGLIGGETFAIDGLRLPSNASIGMSGTKEELGKKLEAYRKMAEKHTAKHRKLDGSGGADKETERRYRERQRHLARQMEKISDFLEGIEPKEGKQSGELKSNVTDNESAMIHSSKGFIQGYIGIAVTDKRNQIIIDAEAAGSSDEGKHLPGILDGTLKNMEDAAVEMPGDNKPTVLMDNNYFSEENLRACKEREMEAIIPDKDYRKRLANPQEQRFQHGDYTCCESGNYYECPNGKRLEYKKTSVHRGREWKEYYASVKDCRACPLIAKCIRSGKNKIKQSKGKTLMISDDTGNLCGEMRDKLNLEEYQYRYADRIQIVEPVFSSIAYCKGLNRFTLRGKSKVNGQWKLYCIVHNLRKCLEGYNEERGYA